MAHNHSHDHDHSQGHSHSHGPGGHSHAENASETRIGIAAGLTGLFMFAEFFGGLVAGSLALIADAGHMLIDFASLAFAFMAFRVARRPPDRLRTFGYDRLQVLVAFANGLILFPVAGWIIWEAAERLMEPAPVLGGLMLWVAAGGLAVNVIAFFVLHGADKDNVNTRGALLHVLGDMLGSVGAIVAAIVIIFSGWTPIDPILSVFVSVIILGGAWRLVRDSGHILLEGTPTRLDTKAIGAAIAEAVPGVIDIHHVHVWSITEKRRMATLHACIAEDADGPRTVRAIKALLTRQFRIEHATVEIERGKCSDGAHGHDHGHAEHGRAAHAHPHVH